MLNANLALLLVPTEPFGRFRAVKYSLPLERIEIRLISRVAISLLDHNASINYRKILGFHGYAMIIKSALFYLYACIFFYFQNRGAEVSINL
jgi:hypothetical protein